MRSSAIVALVLALSLVACRQLTEPVDRRADGILAQGLFIRENGDPLIGADIIIRPEEGELPSEVQINTVTDIKGRFECWVPDVPLRVNLRPSYRTEFPDITESKVRFRAGELRTFLLKGRFRPGIIGPSKFSDLFSDARMRFHYRIPQAGRPPLAQSTSANVQADGVFRIFLPGAGSYRVRMDQAGDDDFHLNYDWPDSVYVAADDTIRVNVPLVSYQLELTMGGQALPDQRFECHLDSWDHYVYCYQAYEANGQDVLFDSLGLENSTEIYFYGTGTGSETNPKFITSFLPISPLREGDRLSFELGEYALRVQVVDEAGSSLSGAPLHIYGEDSRGYSTSVSTNSDGVAYYQLNPGSFRLSVSLGGYLATERYFSLDGDSQMEIVLQELSNKE